MRSGQTYYFHPTKSLNVSHILQYPLHIDRIIEVRCFGGYHIISSLFPVSQIINASTGPHIYIVQIGVFNIGQPKRDGVLMRITVIKYQRKVK